MSMLWYASLVGCHRQGIILTSTRRLIGFTGLKIYRFLRHQANLSLLQDAESIMDAVRWLPAMSLMLYQS